jgi:hypothetical protein
MKARVQIVAVVLLACLLVARARADGGQILLHQASGDFTLTVFATPEPLSTGNATLSVLVQDNASQQLVPNADIALSVRSPNGAETQLQLKQPGLGLFRTADFQFDQAGRWSLTVDAHHGNQFSTAIAEFNVAAAHSRQVVVWTFVSLPWLFVGLFVFQQRLKARARNSMPE